MNNLAGLLANPLFYGVIVGYWIFSAMVGALETPDTNSTKTYRFLFRFAHGLAGNITRAALRFNIPGAAAETTTPTVEQGTAPKQP